MADRSPSDKTRVWLSIGANLGDRAGTMCRALEAIDGLPATNLTDVSSLYATEPVGIKDQPEFLNCAVGLDTTLSPIQLLEGLREIERQLGRTARQRWHEREIDIDILLYGDQILQHENLTVPHPEMHRRRFVLVPLAEIAPQERHPIMDRTIAELLFQLEDTSSVRKVDDSSFSVLIGHHKHDTV